MSVEVEIIMWQCENDGRSMNHIQYQHRRAGQWNGEEL